MLIKFPDGQMMDTNSGGLIISPGTSGGAPTITFGTATYVCADELEQVKILLAIGDAAKSGAAFLELESNAELAITTLTPDSGRYLDQVLITGTGFRPTARVTFGGRPASIKYISGTKLIVYVPQPEVEISIVDVAYSDTRGSSVTKENAFTYTDAASPGAVAWKYVEMFESQLQWNPVTGQTRVKMADNLWHTIALVEGQFLIDENGESE